MPNALLVYPQFPPSYWGMKFALELVGKKSSMPPLGLLTVAGMFPRNYQLKVVDMNVEPLLDSHLEWADFVFTSSMIVQQDSLREVIARCQRQGVPIIAGGPHPTSFHEEMQGVDHFVLDEVENIFSGFLEDFENGNARKIYRAPEKPDIGETPLPRYDLIGLDNYGSMALQFSRGCPFDCEFCDITKLFGRIARTKTHEQMLAEFDLLYHLGWRGSLFLVDDNFIGNKKAVLDLLPHVASWQRERNYPFALFTEASVNLARMDGLMDAMVEAGFSMTFLGIESPNPKALLKTKKKQNTSHGQADYLFQSVRKIQNAGMEVMGGFILGLDGDDENVFDAQIQFIQEAGIPLAMVGLLSALKGTDLYTRLQKEGRLLEESGGDNVSLSLNFVPEMDPQVLVEGYKRVLRTLYDPTLKNYFQRCLTLLSQLKPTPHNVRKIKGYEVVAFLKSLWCQVFSKQGPAYIGFLANVLKRYPRMFPEAVRLAIMGYHFEKITSQQIAIYEFKQTLEGELEEFKRRLNWLKDNQRVGEIQGYVLDAYTRVHSQYKQIHMDFRHHVRDALDSFQEAIRAYASQFCEPVSS